MMEVQDIEKIQTKLSLHQLQIEAFGFSFVWLIVVVVIIVPYGFVL